MNLINDGDFVIVKSSSCLRLHELKRNKLYFLGKRKVNLYSAIGHPFGAYFEIKSNGSLSECNDPSESEKSLLNVGNDCDVKDNRSLIDTGESQKLTTDDIEGFKKEGISGQEMVMKIVENSVSFGEKTAFAREKYLRKKQQKYVHLIQLLKPTIHWIAEMLYMQGPLKICNLRIDTLSQMLAFCNVMSGGRYMVIETITGLLTGSVLERLGEEGCVVQLHLGSFSITNVEHVIKVLKIPEAKLGRLLHHVDIRNAFAILSGGSLELGKEKITCVSDQSSSALMHIKVGKRKHVQNTIDILSLKDMDGLLVAVKNHPANVLSLIDFLASSRPFAIFSIYLEPLVDCYVKLKARGDILSLKITETWFRKYQVLADRTHPEYSMSGSGGFLLTGIKVEPKLQNIV